jgi:proline dehydrogenase
MMGAGTWPTGLRRFLESEDNASDGVVRNALLVGSQNVWLREHLATLPFVRRAVNRFMPGERLADALAAAAELQRFGIGSVLTRLGENIMDAADANETAAHYISVASELQRLGLDGDISVKLTQLGLDIDPQHCQASLLMLADETSRRAIRLWIDMEQSFYVERTLDMRRALRAYSHAGVCLQAYLRRTADDLASIIPLGGGIRLVKGAYREAASIAYPRKHDVDENYLMLATQMLAAARRSGLRCVFGTHDQHLIARLQRYADNAGVPRDVFEFHMLYGIQRSEQIRLAREGYRVKVLISYGEQWFPWYMRRLAERPANLMFLARSMFSS